MRYFIVVLLFLIGTEDFLLSQPKVRSRDGIATTGLHAGVDDLLGIRYSSPIGKNWLLSVAGFYRLNDRNPQTWSNDGHQEYSRMFYMYFEREVAHIPLQDQLDLVTALNIGVGGARRRATFCEDEIDWVPVLYCEPSLQMRWNATQHVNVFLGLSLFHSPTFERDALLALPKGTISFSLLVSP